MPNTENCYRALEKEFESTLAGEIIPGILHNFANPLNGIMGRSKLLQRKLEMDSTGSGSAVDYEALYPKLFRDADLISRDTDKLSHLLQNVAEKFYVINRTSVERINLSELIGMEMDFFDFCLDFKHNVKKNIDLDPEIPELKGVPAELSLSFWALLRLAMLRVKDGELRELHVSSGYADRCVRIGIANSGTFIAQDEWGRMLDLFDGRSRISSDLKPDGLLSATCLLRKYKARFLLETANEMSGLTILIPVD
jgi:signal transduction histidine kinase